MTYTRVVSMLCSMTNRVVDLIDTIGDILWHAALAVVTVLVVVAVATGTLADQGQATAPVATTTAVQDAQSEGTDVVLAFVDATPRDLWDGLLAQGHTGGPVDGVEALYVPVGTVVDVPGGLYRATLDGWAECRDTWFDEECNAAGPAYLTDIPWHAAGYADVYGA